MQHGTMQGLAVELLDDLAPLEAAHDEGIELMRRGELPDGYMQLVYAGMMVLMADGMTRMCQRLLQD